MDLSTLDATQPPDGQAISQGALRIRETRDATKTSVAVEHALAGPHKFPTGAIGSEPAAGNIGRIFLATTNRLLEYDNGSAWQALHAIVPVSAFTAAGFILTGGFQVAQSLGFGNPADGMVAAFAQFEFQEVAGVSIEYKLQISGVDVDTPRTVRSQQTGNFSQCPVAGIRTALPASAVGSVALLVRQTAGAFISVFNRSIVALVC